MKYAAVFLATVLLLSSNAVTVAQNNGASTNSKRSSSAGVAQASATSVGAKPEKAKKKSKPLGKVRVPGEFERQLGIVFSVSDWQPHHFPILQQLIEATAKHVNVLILYNDEKQLKLTLEFLSKSKKDYSHVFFAPLELDTIWLRDFGPRLAELNDGWISIDFFYEGTRPKDDAFPRQYAIDSQMRLRTVRWTVQGGNLLSNGAGLGVTTTRIFRDNRVQFPNPQPGSDPAKEGREMVTTDFKLAFNLDQLIILEPLQNEATQHCDLFVTLIAPDQAVVAQLDKWQDPTNAAILDRNAARLRNATVNGKPMQVHRIKVPPREGNTWSPYTNVILANNLLLMPTYKSDPPAIREQAIATYRRLMPKHHVKVIDMTSMKALQGSLHCLSLNIPEKAPWPKRYFTYGGALKGFENAANKKK